MKLLLMRTLGMEGFTPGRLLIDGEIECLTLEDQEREVKIHGETCIPCGTYRVIITMSARFGKELPLLLGVPGFDGIRIHPGNTIQDTSGCVLVGLRSEGAGGCYLCESRNAMGRLLPKIQAALDADEEVWVTIRADE